MKRNDTSLLLDPPATSGSPAEPTVGEALAGVLARNGFDPTYEDRWVPFPFGRVVLTFYNTPSRRRAARIHDVHHVLTGYDTDFAGEGQIGAWELAVGCWRHPVAVFLNLQALIFGLALRPSAAWRAFRRGRRCRGLYRGPELQRELLDLPLATLQQQVGTDQPILPATWGDRVSFAAWTLAGLAAVLFTFVPAIPLGYATTLAVRASRGR